MSAIDRPWISRITTPYATINRGGATLADYLVTYDFLLKSFCDPKPEGRYRREGLVEIARYEINGDDDHADAREQWPLRQRFVSDVVSRLASDLGIGG